MARAVVRVPATSANLGPGFDAVGLALTWYDDVSAVSLEAPGVEIRVEGQGSTELPRDDRHLVVRAMAAAFEELGVPRPGLLLRCVNRVPHGRGLGSSAAAVVAGVLLANELVDGDRLDHRSALGLAARLEGHPDNAAAALLGGLTVAWDDAADGGGANAVRLEPAASLRAVVLVPHSTLATDQARALLPDSVPHRDAAFSAGRAALLVHALTREPALLMPATEDRLHQAYRGAAMPETLAAVERLRAGGHAAVVSGAGPSVLVLGAGVLDARALAGVVGGGWVGRSVGIDLGGATVTDAAGAGR